MLIAIHQVSVIFIGIATGFFCRKLNIINEQSTSALSNIVVKIVLPFYLFNAIVSSNSGIDAGGVGIAIAMSAGMFLLSGVIAFLFIRLGNAPKEDRGVYLFETMCGNVTYIGIPVCAAIIGGNATFYASLLNIPYNLICFSLGIFMLCGKVSWKSVLNPAFLSGLVAAILYALRVPVPTLITDACSFVGQATSPCAMLIIGSVLAGIPVKDVFSGWRSIAYVFLRLLIIAFIVALIMKFTDVDTELKKVLVLMAAMPAATNSTMLCTLYGGNRELSAKLIFLSTALSIITIPVWAYLISIIL